MALSDDAKKAAFEAARKLKSLLRAETLPATPESTQEMETGSPRTPGYDEHQGKTMKPPPQWPQARAEPAQSQEQERDREQADRDIDR